MKITVNLSTVNVARDRYTLAWTLPLILLGLAGATLMTMTAWRSYRNFRNYRDKYDADIATLAKLSHQETSLVEELNRPQSKEVYRKAAFINDLINQKHFSPTALVIRISKLLPGQSRLVGLTMSTREGTPVVHLIVASSSEDDAENFVNNIGDADDFDDVVIANPVLDQPGNVGGPVSLNCTARYIGTPADLETQAGIAPKGAEDAKPETAKAK